MYTFFSGNLPILAALTAKFSETLLPKLILRTRRRQFSQPNRKTFCSRSEKVVIFSQKYFLRSKCSSGHVECSSDNPAKNTSFKCRKIFARSPRKLHYLQSFSPECSSGQLECSFNKTSRKLLSQSPKIFRSKSEKLLNFFQFSTEDVLLDT